MLRLCRWLALAVIVCAPLTARAQVYCPQPVVAYAPPVVAYAPPPVVAYAPPVVAYAPPAPVVTYAAPAPVSVSTYRYGLFGRRSVTTVTYGAAGRRIRGAGSGAAAGAYYYTPRVYYP